MLKLKHSGKKISIITTNTISYCKQSTTTVLNLMKNSLSDLPEEYSKAFKFFIKN